MYFGLGQDVELYRGGANILETADTFKALAGYKASDDSTGQDATVNACDCSGNVVVLTFKDGLLTATA